MTGFSTSGLQLDVHDPCAMDKALQVQTELNALGPVLCVFARHGSNRLRPVKFKKKTEWKWPGLLNAHLGCVTLTVVQTFSL